MKKKEEFKEFVRKNPVLIKHVKNKSNSWQDFYDLFSLYGEDPKTWSEYFNEPKSSSSELGIGELLSIVKKIDLASAQKAIGNVQKAITLIQDLVVKKPQTPINKYEPKPIYEHLRD